MPESDPIKSKVYACYNKNKSTPSGVVEIEYGAGLIHIGIEEPLLARLTDAFKLAWLLVIHKGFTIASHTMQEKTEQEIADWYAGKGLK